MIVRAKTFKDWLKANFTKQELRDLARYGANTGWYGLTYYEDTCKLYKKFKDEIWDIVMNMVYDFGYKNVFEYMATWSGAEHATSATTFENLMVWFAAEYYAYELTADDE